MASVDIEPATRGDAAAILDLQRLAYRSEAELYGDWSIPPLVETLAELTAAFDCGLFLKALRDGALIGSVRARLDDGGTCHIGRLIVRPECQGQGVGSALMAAVEGRFPEAGRFELFTGHRSGRNLALYGRLGYRECRRQVVSDQVTLVFLEKPG